MVNISMPNLRGVRGSLVKALGCKSSGQGSIPGRDRVKDRFSVLPSQHSCRLVNTRLAFVRTTRTMIVAHVKDPMSIFWYEKA